jgi:hypothetical protein
VPSPNLVLQVSPLIITPEPGGLVGSWGKPQYPRFFVPTYCCTVRINLADSLPLRRDPCNCRGHRGNNVAQLDHRTLAAKPRATHSSQSTATTATAFSLTTKKAFFSRTKKTCSLTLNGLLCNRARRCVASTSSSPLLAESASSIAQKEA